MKRKHLWYSILFLAPLLVLGWSPDASAFTLTVWQNYPPTALVDENAVPIPYGEGLIQLIYAGPNDTIDDPMEWLTCPEKEDWLLSGCPPVGDDVLVGTSPAVNPAVINVALDGYFAKYEFVVTTPVPAGDYLYTRFYTTHQIPGDGPLNIPGQPVLHVDWYGNSPLWVVPAGDVFSYILDAVSPPLQADHPIVPEPSIFFLLGGGLILLLLKRRK